MEREALGRVLGVALSGDCLVALVASSQARAHYDFLL